MAEERSVILMDTSDDNKTSVTATAKVFMSERGIGVTVCDAAGNEIGDVFVEIYGSALKAYVWDEERLGNDPEVTLLKSLEEAG